MFTEAAAIKVKSLIDEEQNPNLNLRVFITGGGCSGFQYGFTFDDTINPTDHQVEKNVADANQGDHAVVRLIVDPFSFQYLEGAEIDYREDMNGAQFVIRNPKAKTTCGCGSSFSVDD
ncbi:MAG TPA: iron-sulfur cluster insertion protein ErpA [Coxiellaceae bacterium]|nr:iron-sulfur cluster insertion protein ErpA [Coxiellaceae bacterium]